MPMIPEPLVSLVCCDLGAIVRGRAVPVRDLDRRGAAGVGWVPANLSLSPLGGIAQPNPFGSTGDLRLRPDRGAEVRIELGDGVPAFHVVPSDIVTTGGAPWRCCPRTFLRGTLDALEAETGARLVASFEHEFQLVGDRAPAAAFSLAAQRRVEPFPSLLMGCLAAAGLEPESFVPEYGAHQFEVPCAPADGMTAADRAVVFRELVREVAERCGHRATFAPLLDLDAVGNGVHIHLSFAGADGRPMLHDATRPAALSELGGRFAAGVLRHATALTALVAPSPVSALRLAPHRWSAGAACLASGDREALLRIPAVLDDPGAQLNLEYRGADATANPYLALGAIVMAGLAGVRDALPPAPVLAGVPDAGAELPRSAEDALDALARDAVARAWLDEQLYDAFVGVKRAELAAVRDLDGRDRCRRYADVY